MTNSISFDRAADFYDQTRDLAEPVATRGIPALLDLLSPRGRILDVGIGTGRIAVPLMKLGADVIGIDLSLKMMAKLREKNPTVRIAQADASQLPFPDHTFDAALTTHVLHLIGPWREALREFKRVIKPGGVYINAWHHHQDRSVNQAVRDMWRERVRAHGVDWRRPGAQLPDDVIAEMKTLGHFEELPLVQYSTTSTARFELDRIADRVMSDAWQVPDEIYDITLNETREWAVREFGDLDRPVVEDRHFIAQVVRFN
jgi:ubiquinone/menaquinone biosynthesis C-methylase UbiE